MGKESGRPEDRIVGHDTDGDPIRAGEIPYFLSRPEFEAWVTNRALRSLQSVNLPMDHVMDREQFLEWARTSNTPGGQTLHEHEAKNYGTADKVVRGKEIPYFLGQAEFVQWTGHKVTEIMIAYDMPPNVNLSRDDFLVLLRKSSSKEGQQLRDIENRVLDVLPDGTQLKIGDIPYFMDREVYHQWMRNEITKRRKKELKSRKTGRSFKTATAPLPHPSSR